MFRRSTKEASKTYTFTISEVATLLSMAAMFNPDRIEDSSLSSVVRRAHEMKDRAKAGENVNLLVVEDFNR